MSTDSSDIETKVAQVFALYQNHGSRDYIGEEVDILTHSILAALEASNDGCDEEVVLAAFLHDIGHLVGFDQKLSQMDKWGTEDHDRVGADYLRARGFSPRICSLVENHVSAKRYLVSAQPEYERNLSEASRQTLKFQGGPMTPEERQKFESDPLRDLYVKFRQWEETAKYPPTKPLPTIQHFHDMAFRHLRSNVLL
jgi:putative nucleotidyltransferase with HDIG domain